jgi:Acetyltransferase (GNAT) domain
MVEASQTAIYFQSREWFEVWSEYAGFRSDTRLITFASGKKVLLPLTSQTLLQGLVRLRLLAPKGMGGFVTSDALDEAEKVELFSTLRRTRMVHYVVQPYDPLTNEISWLGGHDNTQVLELSPGFEAIFRRWSKGHRSAVKTGLKAGITAEPASSAEDWRSYFEFYLDSLARWGGTATNRYDWKLFEILLTKHSPSIRLWLARYEGRPISGALCFYHNRHVAYWHAATSQEAFRKLNASHVLQYFIIKDACQAGYRYYDFMPSGGVEGVMHFKSGFAPGTLPIKTYTSPVVSAANAARARSRGWPLYKALMRGSGF